MWQRHFWKTFFIFIFFSFCHCGEPQNQSSLAEVANKKISVGEFKAALSREKENQDPEIVHQEKQFGELKKKILEDLIQKKILENEAELKRISISEAELEEEIKQYKSRYSEKAFLKVLEQRNINYEDWKELKRSNLLINKWVETFLAPQIKISEEQIQSYYETHLKEFTQGAAVKVRQILSDNESSAKEIQARIQKGENFAKLAKELSLAPERENGGELPWMSKGSFPREFEICFDLKEGQVSEVIPSLYGFHLFKLLAKRPEETFKLEQVKDQIEAWLKKEALEQRLQSYYQQVKPNYVIKVHSWTLKRIKVF
ncbi:MAG: peptidyl-prolyl cis-trans isomerase [Deltaproteobacteria bacterium]|nr:peptidyl-prolyl cis-trans isomerase [Deltaproteobacteria bacterium]